MAKGLEDYSHERKEKAKKNVLYLGIFSICMMFAGFTSAYLVIQRDNFWVSIDMPIAFWVSTCVVLVSSLTIFLTRKNIQKNYNLAKLFLGITVVLGIAFCVLQYIGWKSLIKKGSHIVMPIVNAKGRYDDPYALYYNDKKITYKDGTFQLSGEKISEERKSEMKSLVSNFEDFNQDQIDLTKWYNNGWALYHDEELVSNIDGALYIQDSSLNDIEEVGLKYFADNIIKGYGDFYLKGEYGEDFIITYQGQELTYENRKFYINGEELSPVLYNKLSDSQNTASSFLYIFTGMHVLHLFFGMLYLLRLFIITLKKDFSDNIHLKLKLGSIYWHFVDGLWIYLYLFLLFIH